MKPTFPARGASRPDKGAALPVRRTAVHRSTAPSRAWSGRIAPTYWRASSAGHAAPSPRLVLEGGARALRLPAMVAVVVTLVAGAVVATVPAFAPVADVAIASAPTSETADVPTPAAPETTTAADAAYTSGTTAVLTPAVATTDVSAPRYGIDVSWPQCEKDLPDVALDFAVIGLTAGHASTVNPCLADQVAWAKEQKLQVNLYVVPSSPDASVQARASRIGTCPAGITSCADYAAGTVQARDALHAAKAAKVPATSVWLDVEESVYGTLWSEDTAANVAVLRGWVDTLRAAGTAVGVYSTGGYWTMITDDWQADLPQWVAVGLAGIDAAQTACDRPFTTGPVVVTQWLTGPYDGNLLCTQDKPKATARAAAMFPADWVHGQTRGVPGLLTIPVPHPEIEAQLALLAQAEADAKAKHDAEEKAKADAKAKAKAQAQAKPKTVAKPRPAPSQSPGPTQPAATDQPSTTPSPDPTPDPATTAEPTPAS